jgi:hypothetical protein
MPRICLATVLTAVAAVVVAVPAAASAQGVPDASCPFPGDTDGVATDLGGRYAQTFTAQSTGVVTAAQLEVNDKGETADLRLDIATVATGTPTNNVLDSAPVVDPPPGISVRTGTFQGPGAAVAAGQQYALAVSRPDVAGSTIRVFLSNGCPGTLFYSSSQSGSYLLVGANCCDMAFAVFVEPDADHDGFGDETQDQCPTDASTQGPCPVAPVTPVTTVKKKKCKKHKKNHSASSAKKKKCKKKKK